MIFVDSHCHLNFPDFQNDFDAVLERSKNASVRYHLTIGTKYFDMPALIDLCQSHPRIFCSVGVHPHEAAGFVNCSLKDKIIDYTKNPKVVAIGETGLDYFYETSPKNDQQAVFEEHIVAAEETSLPLIVHTRDADEDTLSLLNPYKGKITGVFHCFTGNLSLAKAALDMGFFISFSGIITFKKAEILKEVVKTIPLDRLLIETDAPYLAPTPHRGKRNEPSYVVHVAECIAELLNLPLSTVANQTTKNFFTLFSKTQPYESI
jgi:TatD DNase family protein